MVDCYAILWVNVDAGVIVEGGIYGERYPTHDQAEVPVELMHVSRSDLGRAKQVLLSIIQERYPVLFKLYFKDA